VQVETHKIVIETNLAKVVETIQYLRLNKKDIN